MANYIGGVGGLGMGLIKEDLRIEIAADGGI